MIFQRTLRRELLSAAGATFTVLFTIILTWTLISILGKAAGGRVASGDVLALIGFAALNYLSTILILTSFISVLMVITRSYRDSEMVVWFASGLSLSSWIRPVLSVGLPLVIVTGLLSFYATPWAKQKSTEYIQRFEKREDLQKVSPGQFKESASSNRIFFVEGASGENTNVHNVFVNTVDEKGTSIVVAKDGTIKADARGDRFLVLRNGRRYQGVPGQPDFQTMEFETYSMRVATKAQVLDSEVNANALPTAVLLENPTPASQAELLWRISVPLSCLVLVMLAIPLGFVNPRASSSSNLIIALLIFFTYNNLMKVFEAGVKQGRLSFGMGWWPLHLAVAVVVLLLFVLRLNVNHRYHPLAVLASLKRGRNVKAAP